MRALIANVIFFGLSLQSFAQVQLNLNANDVNAVLRDDGFFFSDPENNSPGYEIPVGSGNHTCYSLSFWCMAFDSDNDLHAAISGYGSSYSDVFKGPIANDYNSTYYLDRFDTSIWYISRDQINYHVSNYTGVGYVPIPEIANWPGNGNISEGIAEQLAPYVDANNDMVYNPLDGDFPYIQGDAAAYIILNDAAGVHTFSGGLPLGIELHAMFYQYESTDDINNTTFLNVKFFNRSDTVYHDLIFALWMDTDIGFPTDDYVGSDSSLSLAYGYNGDSNDQGGNGQPGYGTNAPAFGVKMLNDSLGSVSTYNNTVGPFGDPTNLTEIYNLISGHWTDGSDMIYNSAPTSFVYNGNPFLHVGWNELDQSNAPADRRFIASSRKYNMVPENSICFDYAFIFTQAAGNALENVNELLSTATFVQDYYDDHIQPCNQIFLDSEEESRFDWSFYPNPNSGDFNLYLPEFSELSLFDMTGTEVYNDKFNAGNSKISVDIRPGIYLVLIRSNGRIFTSKISIN